MVILLDISICTYYVGNKTLQLVSAFIVTIYAIVINRTSVEFILQSVKNKIVKK